ncbi:MAG: U1 small nuclear ribonucleoprotein of 70kDa N-terminal [Olpidium bornovanus]|uniref:U1 small nuclear ribonucleoprotein of 70kDa N-terminal n=1 Tax=Olpidium bornovanus TaxID=278681 RepID=A0A8H7ZZE5_9FUNG|nr:MAG: U1 small nuclear ribonucleoprotein of 70kDa N-terminal [Olpidium bornovanus]
MTEKLPPNLLRLFAPRPPLAYLPPLDRAPEKRRGPQLSGIGEFLEALTSGEHDKDYVPTETLDERRRRRVSRGTNA